MNSPVGWIVWMVVVVETTLSSLPSRQFFIREPDNQTAIQGEQVTLPCRVENKAGFLQWTRDGFGLGETRDLPGYSRYRLIGSDEEKDWTLQIQPVLLEDDAIFQCQVGAADGVLPIRSRFAKLTVFLPPSDPIILQGPVYEIKEGEISRLTCVSPGGKPAADILWYDGTGNMIIENIELKTIRLEDNKRFNTTSTLTFIPRKENHNQTFTCSASNVADRSRRTVSVSLQVEYSPSVKLTASRDPVFEGDTVSFKCLAHSNPDVDGYSWYVDGDRVQGFNSNFFVIRNISRVYHGSVIKCEVSNPVGVTQDSRVINVLYEPQVRLNPGTRAGEEGDTISLHCFIDSNPPPTYTWTRGTSRQAVGSSQNLTVIVSRRTEGEYFCHGISEGFDLVTTHPGRIMLMGQPVIDSPLVQEGIEGTNVRVLCSGVSVPEATGVAWSYMGKEIKPVTEKYEVMTSNEVNFGFSSTLLVRKSEYTDFGYYGCSVTNRFGSDEKSILLNEKENIPVLIITAIVACSLAIILFAIILVVYIRKSCGKTITQDEKTVKPNNIAGTGSDMDHGEWTTNYEDDLYSHQLQNNRENGEYQPKPDLISTGYTPYGNYVRDYPNFPASDSQTSLQSAGQLNPRQSMLLVKDPRYSAAYGNALLCSPPPSLPQYTTFTPPGSSSPLINSRDRIPLEQLNGSSGSSQDPNLDHVRSPDQLQFQQRNANGINGLGSVMGIGPPPHLRHPVTGDLYAAVSKPNLTENPYSSLAIGRSQAQQDDNSQPNQNGDAFLSEPKGVARFNNGTVHSPASEAGKRSSFLQNSLYVTVSKTNDIGTHV